MPAGFPIIVGGATAGRAALSFLARAGSRAVRTGKPAVRAGSSSRSANYGKAVKDTSKTAQARNTARGRKAQAQRMTAQAKKDDWGGSGKDVAFYQRALSNPTARRVSSEVRKKNQQRKAAAYKADAPNRARAAASERLKRQGYKGPTFKGTNASFKGNRMIDHKGQGGWR